MTFLLRFYHERRSMYSKTYGMTLFGIDAHIVGVETDVGGGLPCFEMSGYLNTEVREA